MRRATRRLDRTAAERARKLAATLGAERRGRAVLGHFLVRPSSRGTDSSRWHARKVASTMNQHRFNASAGSLFFGRGGRKKALCCARVVDPTLRACKRCAGRRRSQKGESAAEETHRDEADRGNDGGRGLAGAIRHANAVVHRRNLVLPSLSSSGASTFLCAGTPTQSLHGGFRGSSARFFRPTKKVARRGPHLTPESRRATAIRRFTTHSRQPTTRRGICAIPRGVPARGLAKSPKSASGAKRTKRNHRD